MSTQPQCLICFEEDADMCLPCGGYHWLHRTCWNRVLDKTICPVCRRSVVEEKGSAVARVTRRSRDYSGVIDLIHKIIQWTGPNPDLDHIMSLILNGRELAEANINYVNQLYLLICEEQIDQHLGSLSLQSGPSTQSPRLYVPGAARLPGQWQFSFGEERKEPVHLKKCLRCKVLLPKEAYGHRKRICRSCREIES